MRNLNQRIARNKRIDAIMEKVLFSAGYFTVLITILIVGILFYEAIPFFFEVPVWKVLTDTQWTPLFDDKHYGILPLLAGTIGTSIIALSVALPLGGATSIYLSEFAPPRLREICKPALEILAAVPTVVYGYFALITVSPILAKWIPDLPAFNMLSAGIVMGFMVLPYISSLSEDAMRSVPMHLREGSYAAGATRMQTAFRVVIPASFSGIAAGGILGISRTLGETMIVAIAAGMQPNLTLNPTQGAQTITAYIVQVSMGDLPHGTLEYRTIFVAGLTLMFLSFLFNGLSFYLRKKFYIKELQ